MVNSIKFYGRTKPNSKYWPFSNFYPAIFQDDLGRKWPTSEHYFQAMKFNSAAALNINNEYIITIQEYIRKQSTPSKAAKEGRRRDLPLRNNWESIKNDIMYQALWYKFTQHIDLRNLLCETKDSILIEDSPIDYYWGCGKEGTGKNMLGKLLMLLREELTCKNPQYNCEDCQDCFSEGMSINKYKWT